VGYHECIEVDPKANPNLPPDVAARCQEDAITFQLMVEHEIDKVRGGAHCQLNIEKDMSALRTRVWHARNACLICGSPGHWAKYCPGGCLQHLVRPVDPAALYDSTSGDSGSDSGFNNGDDEDNEDEEANVVLAQVASVEAVTAEMARMTPGANTTSDDGTDDSDGDNSNVESIGFDRTTAPG
jgi:hypothetical protein